MNSNNGNSRGTDYRGTGRLKENTQKRNDKSPDFTGFLTDPSGHKYWLSAWKSKDREGNPFISIRMEDQDNERQYNGRPQGRRNDRRPLYEEARNFQERRPAPAPSPVPEEIGDMPEEIGDPFDGINL